MAAVSVDELRQRLDRGEKVVVVDIRDREDREDWSVPGAVGVDAYHDFTALDELDLPRDAPVVTVCYKGVRSQAAAAHLRERGISASSLAGGMHAWSGAWNVAETRLPSGVGVVQIRRTGKGCLSYIVASDGEALAVDVAVDVEVVQSILRERGWRLVGVLETHIHADHVTRGRRLAEAAGAPYFLPANPRSRFAFRALADGDVVSFGSSSLRTIAVPGHTDESAAYAVDGAVLTGDTLFLTSVGRPDLEADPAGAERRATALHGSLAKLLRLPPATLVLPAHAPEPLPFDRRMHAAPLDEVRPRVPALALDGRAFVERVLGRLPPPPENAHQIVAVNETGAWPGPGTANLEAGGNRCAAG